MRLMRHSSPVEGEEFEGGEGMSLERRVLGWDSSLARLVPNGRLLQVHFPTELISASVLQGRLE